MGLVDLAGKLLIEPTYDHMRILHSNRIAIEVDGLWGVTDSRGRSIAPPKYQDIGYEFSEGLVKVKHNELWGYLNEDCKMVIATQFEDAGSFRDGHAIIQLKGKQRTINHAGKVVVPVKSDETENFENIVIEEIRKVLNRDPLNINLKHLFWNDDVAVVCCSAPGGHCQNNPLLRGVIDRQGKLILKPEFSKIMVINANRFLVWKGGSVRLIDSAGKCLALCDRKYTWASSILSEGMRAVAVGDDKLMPEHPDRSHGRKFGFVNRWWKLVIEPKYDDAEPFEGGLARVNIGAGRTIDGTVVGGKWGYIDRDGHWIWKQHD